VDIKADIRVDIQADVRTDSSARGVDNDFWRGSKSTVLQVWEPPELNLTFQIVFPKYFGTRQQLQCSWLRGTPVLVAAARTAAPAAPLKPCPCAVIVTDIQVYERSMPRLFAVRRGAAPRETQRPCCGAAFGDGDAVLDRSGTLLPTAISLSPKSHSSQ